MQFPTDAFRISVFSQSVTLLKGIAVIIFALMALKLVELVFFGSGYYATLAFHPFWIVVIMAPLLQGFSGGIAAMVLASLLLGLPDRGIGEDAIGYLVRSADLPLRWLVVALLIGLVRQIQIDENERLQDDLRQTASDRDQLAHEVERMDRLLADLERKAAARPMPEKEKPTLVPVAPEAPSIDHFGQVAALLQLADAQDAQIGPAFDFAAKLLLEGPACLLFISPLDSPMILGQASLPAEINSEDLARATPRTRCIRSFPVAVCRSQDEPQVSVLVIGPEGADPELLRHLVEAARIAFDRLSARLTEHLAHDSA